MVEDEALGQGQKWLIWRLSKAVPVRGRLLLVEDGSFNGGEASYSLARQKWWREEEEPKPC